MRQTEPNPAPPTYGTRMSDVIAGLRTVGRRETMTLRDLIEAGGTTSFVPALMIPAILVVSPLSGIPVFSSLMGLTIALIAGQMLVGRVHLWLPRLLMERRLSGARVTPALDRTARLAAWIDRHSRNRLRLLTAMPLVKVPQTLAMLCGLAMPFLELVPFSSTLLGLAVVFFAVGFVARDGVYVVAGVAVMAIAAAVPVTIWGQIAG